MPVRRSWHRPFRRGLTLLELVVAISLIIMILGAILTFYWQTAETRDQVARLADRTQLARQVLERMAAELRGCPGVRQLGFPAAQRISGTRRSITFITTALPEESHYRFYGEFDKLPPGQHDLREISYELWVDPHKTTDAGEPLVGGIIRTEKRTLNQLVIDEREPLQIRHDLWAPELGYLEFRYFDGVEWTTTWDLTEGNPLPYLIQITVGFDSIARDELEDKDLTVYPIEEYPLGDDQPHPDRYRMMVRIPAADRMFSTRLQRIAKEFSEQFGLEGGK